MRTHPPASSALPAISISPKWPAVRAGRPPQTRGRHRDRGQHPAPLFFEPNPDGTRLGVPRHISQWLLSDAEDGQPRLYSELKARTDLELPLDRRRLLHPLQLLLHCPAKAVLGLDGGGTEIEQQNPEAVLGCRDGCLHLAQLARADYPSVFRDSISRRNMAASRTCSESAWMSSAMRRRSSSWAATS